MSWTLRVRSSVAVVVAALVSSLLVVLPVAPAHASTFPPGVARFSGSVDWTYGTGLHFPVTFTVEPRIVPGYTADSLWTFTGRSSAADSQRPSSTVGLDMQCPDGSWHEAGAALPWQVQPQYFEPVNTNGCGLGVGPVAFGMRFRSISTIPGTSLIGGAFAAGVFRVGDPTAYTGGGNPDEGCTTCPEGDPVNTATGDLFESATDVALPGSSPLGMSRTYSSLSAGTDGPLGFGWSTPLSAKVAVPASSGQPAKLIHENGSTSTFYTSDGASFAGAAETHATLVKDSGTGAWSSVRRGNQRWSFDAGGKLLSVTDRAGVTTSVAYSLSTPSQVASVATPDGRALTVVYNASGRIQSVTGPSASGTPARQVVYGYDASGNLTTVTDSRGKVWHYEYNTFHQMTAMVTPTGARTETTFDQGGRALTQKSPRGKTTTFDYVDSSISTGSRRVTTVTDPTGVVTKYQYDNLWLTAVTVGSGGSASTTTMVNNDQGLALTTTDPTGVVRTRTYDASGNVLTDTVPAGPADAAGAVAGTTTTTWTYNAFNEPLTKTDSAGHGTVWTYDTAGNPLTRTVALNATQNAVTTWVYADAVHPTLPTKITDAGNTVTDLVYTPEGFTASSTSTAGNVSGTTDTTARTTFTYDPYGDVLTVVDPRGNVAGGTPANYRTTYTYDTGGLRLTAKTPLGFTTTYGYDDDGRPTTRTNQAGKTWTTYYLPGGLVDHEVNPLTITTGTLTYDDADRPATSTNGVGDTTSTTYDDHGRLATTIRPAGNVPGASAATKAAATTTYGYDLAGRLLTSSTPNPAGGAPIVTSTVYDQAGRVWKQLDPLTRTTVTRYDALDRVDRVTDPRGYWTGYGYDWAGRTTTVTDRRGNTTTTTYDQAGHRIKQVDPLATATSPSGRTTTWTYDTAGRLWKTTDPRGNATGATAANYTSVTTYDIAGNVLQVADNLGRTWKSTWDRDGRLATKVSGKARTTTYAYEPLTGTGAGPGRLWKITAPDTGVTVFGYDAADRRTTITAPQGGVWATGYDNADRVTSETDPAAVARSYTYTPDGQVATVVTPRGTTTLGYDSLDRLTGRTYTGTTTPAVGYSYDAASQRTGMTDATGSTVFGYDDDGNLLTKTLTPTSGPTQSWTYTYDANGNVLTRSRPDASVETWTYDSADLPTQVVAPTGTTTFTYDDAGHPLVTTSPNGTTETRTWDRNGYLATTVTKKAASTLTSQTVTRDNANQPTKNVLVRSGTTENRSYLYDTNERITAVCYAATCTAATATQQWTYDKDGNRLTEINGVSSPVTTTWTYDTSDRILTQRIGTAAATVPTYDADGNLTADGTGRTWTHRLDGLQATATAGGATTGYSYDGDGHRTSAVITAGTGAGTTTAYTWDTNTPLAMLSGISRDPDGTGPTAPSTTAIRYDGAGVGTPISQTVDGTTSWYAHDPLVSVTDLVSSSGAITRAQDWTPYGATRTAAGAPGTPTGPGFALGWTGALPDSDGTWHLRARQYDPTTGAFTTRDPIGYTGSAGENNWYGTPYGYVTGRVAFGIDPTGRNCWNPWDSSGEECAVWDGLARTLSGKNDDTLLGSLVHNTSNVAVNFGRGASGGLTDTFDDSVSPGASCTVDADSFQARLSQGLGFAGSIVVSGGGRAGAGLWSRIRSIPWGSDAGELSLGATVRGGRDIAEEGGLRALPSGAKIAAEWGADTYRHGGLMSTIEHINYRHAFGSGFSGVSRYAKSTSVRDIKGYVDYVLRNGTVTERGMIGNVGTTIGTDAAGNSVTGLEVIVRDGMIKTAFPVAVP